MANELNLWSSTTNSGILNSTDLALQDNCKNGFGSNDYLISSNFNTILRETSLVTKALIDALFVRNVNPSINTTAPTLETINSKTELTTLRNAIVNTLNGLVSQSSPTTSADNLSGGGQGQIPIQSGVGTTTFITGGSSGQYLKKTSTGATWATLPTGTSVEGNPSSAVTESELLSKIKINNKVYGVSAVKANETIPSGASNLTSLKIGGTTYAIPSCNVPSASGQNGKLLSVSSNNPVWKNPDDINVGSANTAFGLSAFSMSYENGLLTITYTEE